MTGPSQGLGLDLELGVRELGVSEPGGNELDVRGRLTALGAVFAEAELSRRVSGEPLAALQALDAFAAPAAFVFGHNIYWHDLPWLAAHAPDLALLRKPAVDTLVLSALAFAEHPYHALLKDYKLVRHARNDPGGDARIAGQLLTDACQRLRELSEANPPFGRVLRGLSPLAMRAVSPQAAAGMALVFAEFSEPPSDLDADLRALLEGQVCAPALARLMPVADLPADEQLALLFAVAWLRVAGTPGTTSPSVVMPWVRRQLPAVSALLAHLRDTPCGDTACTWCRAAHDPVAQLQRWFQYPDFRAEPALPDGRGAQRAIVDAGFADRPLLALLPTGGGKSLCFQLPAIQRALRRGCLTIVISPLQSLMHDQVDNFVAKTRSDCAWALTGRLTPPERRVTLDAVRSGQAGIVYVSPEQLRNATFRKAIALREIGAWVFDEAHCLSKWGHDFRPDYLYAARFVREFSATQGGAAAPIVCVTATAKPEVRDEILQHFRTELGQELQVFDGHAARENLSLRVESLPGAAKVSRLCELVAEQLTLAPTGSVLVYTATRRNAEEVAARLITAGIDAEAFHAGLDVPTKKAVQARFLGGERRVVCATNAFGMGIDKPDIRLVVHFEIPGSLEAYVQEVGRAGRDGRPADAVLLFAEDDIETQFRLSAKSRLSRRDLQGILRRIRRLSRPTPTPALARADHVREAICTAGEILQDDELADSIPPSDRGAPTRVVTAIAWLERGQFLRRDENATTIFQGRPLVKTLAEARQRIDALSLPPAKATAWRAILARLMNAEPDDGFSSDDFLGLPEVVSILAPGDAAAAGRAVLRILVEMQKARLLSTGVRMTAFVRLGVTSPSLARLEAAARLEDEILDLLREHAPDLDERRAWPLSLRSLTQSLTLRERTTSLDEVRAVLGSLVDRALHAGHRTPGLGVRFTSREHCDVEVRGTWGEVAAASRRRHLLAEVCLQVMLAPLQKAAARGASLLAEFAFEDLLKALEQNLELASHPSRDRTVELEDALLFLHRVDAIVLHKGLAVFRQAMVLRVPETSMGRKFGREDFEPLDLHQAQRTVQIHVMHEFARRMAETPAAGLRLLDDYFRLPGDRFLDRHFPGRGEEVARATSPESWQSIVTDLNAAQRRIVEASEHESLLVLAGPGSGKTRVVVHRCAYLLRVRRVPARAILVLCFNRSAALELRRRLRALVGADAQGVLIQTYHGMAARLVGRSPAAMADAGIPVAEIFGTILHDAIALLEAGNAAPTEADLEGDDDGLRDRLLAGFRHILVDEYQDIDEQQYRLVSAIAGRTLHDEERKLTVLAVGDDDQNIYQWRGSNVEFLRRFEADYHARRVALVENYRSTAHILAVAHAVISLNQDRLKGDTEVRVDDGRRGQDAGGRFADLDAASRGRVHVLEVERLTDQALAVRDELRRLARCDPDFAWDQCAVLSPRHEFLDPVRTVLEEAAIPVRHRVGKAQEYSLFRLREVQAFLAAVEAHGEAWVDARVLADLLRELRTQFRPGPGLALTEESAAAFVDEHGEGPCPKHLVGAFFGELLMEQRRERVLGEGVMLSTVHGSKGEEYAHVVVLDGAWQPRGAGTGEELRRLYYVAMTRARQTLTLVQVAEGDRAAWLPTLQGDALHRTRVNVPADSPTMPRVRYELLSQADLWLAYPGRGAGHARMADAIAALATGDPLRFASTPGRLFVENHAGERIAALSAKGSERWRPRLPSIVDLRVAAILVRRRQDENADYQAGLARDAWCVVIPEVRYVDPATE